MKTNLETPDFRQVLQKELISRIRANPRYSLRAFAKFLRVEPSQLSKILRNQRPVSRELIERMGQQLSMDFKTIEKFKSMAKARKPRELPAPELSGKGLTLSPVYARISEDTFEVISDWRHCAILELIKIDGFESTPKWIAKAIGINAVEARASIERLIRVGILEVQPDGRWVDRTDGFSSSILGANKTSHAQRRYQMEMLSQSIRAVQETPIEHRDNTSIMMATSYERITKAKVMIKKFRRHLCKYLEGAQRKDAIYQLGISLYPLTQAPKSTLKTKGKKS